MMTTEEKAKAYDTTLKAARNELKQDTHESVIRALQRIFPQLKESEDEKIRKEMIEFLNQYKKDGLRGVDITPWIAYLEKQKDASKAIEAVDRIDEYIDEHVANAHDMKDSNPNKKYYHGWDDALAEMSGILQDVYSGGKQKEQKSITNDEQQECPYKDLALVKNFFGVYKRKCKLSNKACDSKECEQWNELQADFRNINEAFENGKKEVVAHPEKYGLCKPAEWGEEDWNNLNRIAAILVEGANVQNWWSKERLISKDEMQKLTDWLKTLHPQAKQEWSEEDKKQFNIVLDSLRYAYEDLNNNKSFDTANVVKKAFDWMQYCFKSLHPQKLDASKLENFDPVDVLNRIKTEWPMAWDKVVPKQEWSDEDSANLERVDNYLWMLDDYVGDDSAMPQRKTDKIRGNIQGILSSWLKSLPERFNLQPKQDVFPSLSEKEIIFLKRALDYLRKEHNRYGGEDFTNEIAVLEWLITHPILISDTHWKPSEEQMEALNEAVSTFDGYEESDAIKSLYNQLKKLGVKEEPEYYQHFDPDC